MKSNRRRYTEDREWTASLTLLGCILGIIVIIMIKVGEKLCG